MQLNVPYIAIGKDREGPELSAYFCRIGRHNHRPFKHSGLASLDGQVTGQVYTSTTQGPRGGL